MAFQWIDGFEPYPAINVNSQDLQAVWTFLNTYSNGALAMVPGRFTGSQGVQASAPPGGVFSSSCFSQPVSGSAFSLGFAFKLGTPSPPNTGARNVCEIATFFNGFGVNWLCGVGFNTSQQIVFFTGNPYNGATIVATGAVVVPVGGWHFLEMVGTFGGTVTIYLDGVLLISAAAMPAGSPTALSFHLSNGLGTGGTYTVTYDDVFCTNTAVRVGESRVQTLVPSSNSSVQWTPLAGQNYAEVAGLPAVGDAAYVSTATVGNQDLYGHTALSGVPTNIYAVQARCCARKDDSASRQIATVLSSTGTVSVGATYAVTGSYQYQRDIYPTDPHTSAAWTGAAVNASLIGQKVIL